jgi:hypothetical protein
VRRLNPAQRVVIVVALGAIAVACDAAVGAPRGGWFGYAPNTSIVYEPGISALVRLVLRCVLAAVWAVISIVLLRRRRDD